MKIMSKIKILTIVIFIYCVSLIIYDIPEQELMYGAQHPINFITECCVHTLLSFMHNLQNIYSLTPYITCLFIAFCIKWVRNKNFGILWFTLIVLILTTTNPYCLYFIFILAGVVFSIFYYIMYYIASCVNII